MPEGLSEAWEHSNREDREKREAYAPISDAYTGDGCNNPACGRCRVIEYRNGKKVCEKCHWDQDAKQYDGTHSELFG